MSLSMSIFAPCCINGTKTPVIHFVDCPFLLGLSKVKTTSHY
jgi:hypothetical protein